VTPNFATIVTPIRPSGVEACRRFLRDYAEPQPGTGRSFIECRPLFRFDKVSTLHFCSFVVLDAENGFGPSLVFEATFDGARDVFLKDLLDVAADGFDSVYRWCVGYPGYASESPELAKEYLIRHDVGADTFFSGSPGRMVSQIRNEGGIRDEISSFLAGRCGVGAAIPARPSGILDLVRRDVIGATPDNCWAQQAAPLPWEVVNRDTIGNIAKAGALVLAGCLGAIVCSAFGYGPAALFHSMAPWFDAANQFGRHLDSGVAAAFPWLVNLFALIDRSGLHALTALIVAWLALRIVELVLGGITSEVRDQVFVKRFPLHLAVIARYAVVAFLAGAVALAVISGASQPQPPKAGGVWVTFGVLIAAVAQLVLIGILFLAASYWATSLKIAVELQPLDAMQEGWRRFRLDIAMFAMAVLGSMAILLIASIFPQSLVSRLGVFDVPVRIYFLAVVLCAAGIFTIYAAGLVMFAIIAALEWRDKTKFRNSSELIERTAENAPKYAREEGGINRYQNHLASLTNVKPGIVRYLLLRSILFAVNLLSRFWFNRGELGGIPTILSARWVMIDGGRRLLFLDNYGGSWESYLNEFIDLAAVKGLNAIWTNTFVCAGDRQHGFPPTQLLFWRGAQNARPFKAYVRQSQIETLVWYSAYPTLGVVGINANSEVRQSLSGQLAPATLDRLLQSL
jgi:hypothetical protein